MLILCLFVGFLTLWVDGIPEIGIRNFLKGEYENLFHVSMADAISGSESLNGWNRILNGFYSFTGFGEKDNVQMLVPIVNDGADHGAHLSEPPTTGVTENEDISATEIPVISTEDVNIPPSESTPSADAEEVEETETAEETLPPEEEPDAEALGQILLMGDRAMELPKADYESILKYSASVNAIAEALDGINVYSLLVPNSAGIYAPSAYQQGEDNQETMIDYAYENMGDAIQCIDAYTVLEKHKKEYLYFRTDHHWTHLGSYYAYTAFCESAGLTVDPLSMYDSGSYDTFLGTMYSYLSGYSQRQILKDNPDSLTYYIPYRETTARYYDSQGMAYGSKIDMVYSLSESYSNKYICFLGGDHPITVIETDCPEERVCLLIKESYGNAFATWLTGHYSKIICIDPREFNRNDKPALDLQSFAEKLGVDDCIILNYPIMINSSAYAAWLGRLVQ